MSTERKFKVGDTVQRAIGNWADYKVGVNYTVSEVDEDGGIKCVGIDYPGFAAKKNFILIEECPISPLDTQVGGDHYKTMGIQPLEACYLRYGYAGLKASIHTKIDKYFRTKDNEVEDLKKAKHCLEILIEKAELEVK